MYNLKKLKELGIESITLKASGCRDEMNYIDDELKDWFYQQEECKYVIDVCISIYGIIPDDEKEVFIGRLEGNFFETVEELEDTDFINICDSISTDLTSMAAEITDKNGDIKDEICDYDENIMYIDRIYIEEKYRGLGIASYVIENLNGILRYTSRIDPHVLVLLPAPQEKDESGSLSEVKDENEREKQLNKLLKFYKKLGFKNIKNSKYMFKRVRKRFYEMEEFI